jgi:putative PIN family toxin of toxin-antitoxin system
MITAILDTNVVVQAVIGSPRSASARVLEAFRQSAFQLVFSHDGYQETVNVLALPQIRARHGWSDDEIHTFVRFLLLNSKVYQHLPSVSATVTRDVTDTKLLGLCQASAADFLVTNDRRHLLRLKKHGRTRIVTPAAFMRQLPW